MVRLTVVVTFVVIWMNSRNATSVMGLLAQSISAVMGAALNAPILPKNEAKIF